MESSLLITRYEELVLEVQMMLNASPDDTNYFLSRFRPYTNKFIRKYYKHHRNDEMLSLDTFSTYLKIAINCPEMVVIFSARYPNTRDWDQTFHAVHFGVRALTWVLGPGCPGIKCEAKVFTLFYLTLLAAVAAWEEKNPIHPAELSAN